MQNFLTRNHLKMYDHIFIINKFIIIIHLDDDSPFTNVNSRLNEPEGSQRKRLESTSLLRTPIDDKALQDFHQHKLVGEINPLDLKYNLYAVVVCYSKYYYFLFF